MAVKQWNVGDVLTASDMNAWTVPLAAIKAADTGRNNTTTVTADPDLVVAVASAATYLFWSIFEYTGGTNASSDGQVGFTVPAGTTGWFVFQRINVVGLAFGFTNSTFGTGNALQFGTNGTGNLLQGVIHGQLTTAGTAGNLSFVWAQNTSNATNTTIKAGSYLYAQRIG